MGGPFLDGIDAATGAAMGAPATDASEAEDPLVLLSLPPPSSLCRFIPQPQHVGGSTYKQRGAAKSATASGSKQQSKPPGIAFDSPGVAALTRLAPSLLPDFLRRHFLPSEPPGVPEKQQLAKLAGDIATARECAQHPTYTARVSELSPLSVVLLLSLVARLRQRQQQQQQQQMIAKLLHLERHMRRRMLQQQHQQQAGGRHSTASRTRTPAAAAAAAAARQPWAGVSSWIAAASSSSSAAEVTPLAEGSFYDTADTYAGLRQRMATAMQALTSLAKAEVRHQEALGSPERPAEGQQPGGHPEALQGRRRFPSWLPAFVAAQMEEPTASDSAAPAVPAYRGSAASASFEAAGAEGAASSQAATFAGGAVASVPDKVQQQPVDLASLVGDAAKQMQQHEMRLWQWCLAAANFDVCKLKGFGSFQEALSAYEGASAASSSAGGAARFGGPQCISATPRQWAAALLRVADSVPPEVAVVAIAAPGGVKGQTPDEETERLLRAVRQCAAAASAAAAAAAAVSPARFLMQEAERLRRCYLCGCGFAMRLEEQQQQFYLRDAVVVMLQQQQHQQELAAAIVSAVAPAVRCAAAHMMNCSNSSMQADGDEDQGAGIHITGLPAAATEISSGPLLRLAVVHHMDTFSDSRQQQQQEHQHQHQQPKYMQLSSRIGTQPAALSVALEVEGAVLLEQTGEGTADAAATAAARGRAAGAADAAAAEAAYRSLVRMAMADGELEPLQQEMLGLLRQQLADRKQCSAAAAVTQQQKEDILPRVGDSAAATMGTNLTVERVLPTDVVYVHCDCYVQHLQQQASFFRLLLLLLCCSGTQQNVQVLRAVGQLVLQQLQLQHCSKRKHQTMRNLPEQSTEPDQKIGNADAAALPPRLIVRGPIGRKPRRRF